MNQDASQTTVSPPLRWPIAVAAGAACLAVAAAAFYGWLQHGSSILLTLGETGLSWCF